MQTFKLTRAQIGVYFECMEDPASTMYNIAFSLPLFKGVDIDRFAGAVAAVTLKHPALFVTFREEKGIPVMAVDDSFKEAQLKGRDAIEIKRSSYDSIERAKREFVRPFDLKRGPLYRFEICETKEGYTFLLDVHHLVFDGTSLRLFYNQIAKAYAGEDIQDETKGLFDIALFEETIEETDEYKAASAFFDDKLSDVDFDSLLISDLPDKSSAGPADEGIYNAPEFSALSKDEIKKFTKENGITESTFFMSAFAYALAEYSAGGSCAFVTASSGRHKRNLESAVGMFVKTMPFFYSFKEDLKIADNLRDIQKNYYEILSHDCIYFGDLVQKYAANADVYFAYQGRLLSEVEIDGNVSCPQKLALSKIPNKFFCMTVEKADHYELEFHYLKNLFSSELIEYFAETVYAIAKGFLSCEYFSEIALMGPKGQLLYKNSNATEFPIDTDKTVNDLFKMASDKNPENTALVYKDKKYTYEEFDAITRKIAAAIHDKGIGIDDFVAVMAPRCDLTVLSLWGVIRAGAAIVPLDPAYPADRLNYMIKDSGAKLLMASASDSEMLSEYKGDVLDAESIINGHYESPDADALNIKDSPNSVISVIYTSGTTGMPKGGVLENRNLAALFNNMKHNMELDGEVRIASYASFGFDAGLMDIIVSLLSGGALYIIPDEYRLDFAKLEEFYINNKITHGFMTTQVGRMFAESTKSTSLKVFLIGGEKMVPFTYSGNFRVVNGYGPSETMAYVCSHDVTDDDTFQPIGRPNDNTKLYVMDKAGRLMPPGAVGEMCIAGYQVGRGYLNLPQKTKEAFAKNPFEDKAGYERMYRTGDMVRLLPAGEFDFVGRCDGQVKIRGFRVELTEIEEVIRRFDGIKDATVAAFDDAQGGKYIAAYVAADAPVDIAALNDFIGRQKPSYMVPAIIMQLDEIPYTQNQKVNKRALPKPERVRSENVMPRNNTQQKIYDAAAKALGHSDFGITTDLFTAGLTSIGLIKFNVLIEEALGKPLTISDVKSHKTITELETFLMEKNDAEEYPRYSVYPLMANQMGIFIESGQEKNSVNYNVPALFKLSPEIDASRLRDALCRAIDAHPYMKTVLTSDTKGNVFALRQDDEEAVTDFIMSRYLPAKLILPFDLIGGRLYRAAVYVTDEGKYLFIDAHHIVSDGTSLALLLNDINAAYEGREVQKESYTCYEAALDEDSKKAKGALDEAGTYYKKLLTGCNTQCLPVKAPSKDSSSEKGSERVYYFNESSGKITEYINDNKLSANAFFNAAFAYTLGNFIHAEDVTYCTVYNGRSDSRTSSSFGMFVKTLPVRCFIDEDKSILDFVRAMQTQLVDTMANDNVSFAELAQDYGLKSELFFNYQGENFNFDNIGGKEAEAIPLPNEPKTPLSIEVFLKDGVYRAVVNFRRDCYCDEFADSFMSAFMMASLGFAGEDKLSSVSLISEEEKEFIKKVNETHEEYVKLPAHKIYEMAAGRTPDAIAVKTQDASLTFKELDEQSNIIANALIGRKIKSDEVVGVILERTHLVPAAELGILKSGGAFMNMLPSYPDERIEFCLKDAACRYVMTTQAVIDARSELFAPDKPFKALCIDKLLENNQDADTDTPQVDISFDQLAYCIYTSGSTGTPKGVMIEHHNLTNFIQTAGLRKLEEKGSTILCMSSISFDMSLTEMIFSLCMGRTIYIASDEEIHNPDLMLKAMLDNHVDIMMMTPSFAVSLLSIPAFAPALAHLKAIALGAEAFKPTLYSKLKSLNPYMVIVNGYGPTECTQVCSAKFLESGDNPTIGRPFANTKFHILNKCGNPLPRFAIGELVICGEGVCRGYVNLPDKNKAAFTQIDGIRGYRSGDLVYINAEGEALFAGRADNQVKLRGFRVELDEIEAVMQEFEGIGTCRVIVQNNGTEDYLVGFYTADYEIDKAALTSYLKTKLTYYMVPAALKQLEEMPLTQNGKIDKKALPLVEPEKSKGAGRIAGSRLEIKIAELIKKTLSLDNCYADDNFFEIGGTSLSASKIVMQLKADGYIIEYQDIFDHQTVEELAEFLSGDTAETDNEAAYGSDNGGNAKEEMSALETVKEEAAESDKEDNIHKLLKCNTMECAPEAVRESLGDVFLTGATGFLGIHILKELLTSESGRVICLLRRGRFEDIKSRLESSLVYYFEDDFKEAFLNRIILIEGDITDENLPELFEGIEFDTLINCAASVKHFANDDSILFVNVSGVENLIALAKGKNAKMIQISTTSVPGAHTQKTYREHLTMHENELFVVDDMNNQYCQSKYQAELRMLEAIRSGLRGKIIRVGNLMGRYSDGEFQTNMRTNAFLNGLRGFVTIGKCPLSHATDPMSFSPVDCTARAVVLLAGTNDMFTAFHAESRSRFDEMKIVEAVNRCGIKLTPVQDKEYYDDFYRMMGDDKKNEKISALLTNDRPDVHMVTVDTSFTANVLYRLGFSWPFIDDEYLDKVIESLDTLDFFFED